MVINKCGVKNGISWNKGKKGYTNSGSFKVGHLGLIGDKSPVWIKERDSMRKRIKEQEKIAGRPKPEQCEICGAIDCRICFDHNHLTGEFRGWVCTRCNIIMGLSKDNIDILMEIIKYLKK